jgi:hypothetical protein
MDALRTADGTLITTEDIALRVIKANGFDAAESRSWRNPTARSLMGISGLKPPANSG